MNIFLIITAVVSVSLAAPDKYEQQRTVSLSPDIVQGLRPRQQQASFLHGRTSLTPFSGFDESLDRVSPFAGKAVDNLSQSGFHRLSAGIGGTRGRTAPLANTDQARTAQFVGRRGQFDFVQQNSGYESSQEQPLFPQNHQQNSGFGNLEPQLEGFRGKNALPSVSNVNEEPNAAYASNNDRDFHAPGRNQQRLLPAASFALQNGKSEAQHNFVRGEENFAGQSQTSYEGNEGQQQPEELFGDHQFNNQFNDQQLKNQPFGNQQFENKQFEGQQFEIQQFENQQFGRQQVENQQFGNQQFENQQFGSQQFENRQIGNQQFENQQFENQQFENQQFGNQQFENHQFGNQQFENQQFENNRFDSKEGQLKDTRLPDGKESNIRCHGEEVVGSSGRCVRPKITRNVFVYQKPEKKDISGRTEEKRLNYNILFIKNSNKDSASDDEGEKKTIVYVLNKEPTREERKQLEDNHEVYFVNYKEGENPVLPHGSRLQTELSLSGQDGEQHNSNQQEDNAANTVQYEQNSFRDSRNNNGFGHLPGTALVSRGTSGLGTKAQAVFFRTERPSAGTNAHDEAPFNNRGDDAISSTISLGTSASSGGRLAGKNTRTGNVDHTGKFRFPVSQELQQLERGAGEQPVRSYQAPI